MYLPPVASWVAGDVRWLRRLVALWLVAACMVCAGFVWTQPWGAGAGLVLASLIFSSAAARYGLRRVPRGSLQWDGRQWHWSGETPRELNRVMLVLDLQRCLLVRVEWASGQGLWLWLESDAMNTPWLALRRALVVRGQVQAGLEPASLP